QYGWRPNWQKYLDYIEAEVYELGVCLELSTAATAESVLQLNPDSVIIATGSRVRQGFLDSGHLRLVDGDTIISETPSPNDNTRALIIDEEAHMVAPNAA